MAAPVADAQVPEAGSITIDHVAHFAPDVDAASDALVDLGFTLTPFSAQSHRLTPEGPLVPAGTGNRCVMLERGYLEFLTPTGKTPVANQLHSAIARYVGVHLIAFGTATPQSDHARLVQHGFEPLPPVALQRPIETAGGMDTARFTVVRVAPGTMPEGRIQFCQHHTPALVWQQRWMSHRNAATALVAVWLCVPDAAEAAQRYGRFTGRPPTCTSKVWTLDTGRGTLNFAEPPQFEHSLGIRAPALPWIAGYTLETADPDTTRNVLVEAGFEPRALGNGVLMTVLPEALGGLILFQPRGSGTPAAVLGT